MSSNTVQNPIQNDERHQHDFEATLSSSLYLTLHPMKLHKRYLPEKDSQLDTHTSPPKILDELSKASRARASKLNSLVGMQSLIPSNDDHIRIAKSNCSVRFIHKEVLLLVFDNYMDSSSNSAPGDCFAVVDFRPWLLSQVCREWRQIMFSCSCYWVKVVFYGTPSYERRTESRSDNAALFLLSQQMILSKNQSLSVTIRPGGPSDIIHTNPELFDFLLPHRHRWRKLSVEQLNTVDDDTARDLHLMLFRKFSPTSDIPLEFSLLEDLCVDIGVYTPNYPIFPRLKHATLSTSRLCPWPGGIPWSNLITLDIYKATTTQIVSILPSLTNVRKLSLTDITTDAFILSAHLLPCLENVSLYPEAIPIMDAITAPSLKRFAIEYINDEGHPDPHNVTFRPIIDMIHRSSCSTTSLEITLPVSSDPPLHSLLSSLPRLTELCVTCYTLEGATLSYIRDLVYALAALNPEGGLLVCPQLANMELAMYNDGDRFGDDHEVGQFLVMLERRRRGGHLRKVRLESFDQDDDSLFSRGLDELYSRGLDLVVIE